MNHKNHNKMYKTLLIFTLTFFSVSFYTQENMVKNYDFELVEKKMVKKLGALDEFCQEWFSATRSPADVFVSGVKSDKARVPDNMFGDESAYSGDSYAGFRAYSKDKKMSRSYVSIKLKKSLTAGKQYCVRINVSLADLSKYAVNNIGILLANKKLIQANTSDIIEKPQILQKTNKVMNNMEGWETICGTFVATGKEKYVIIGNFERNDKLKIEKMKRPKGYTVPQKYHAYYYLDDVVVNEIEAKSQCVCSKEDEKEPEVIYSYTIRTTEESTPEDLINQYRVYYANIKYQVNAIGKRDLNKLVVLLQANPSININVVGHCTQEEIDEGKISSRYREIGKKRADLVAQYLISKGIDASRISINSLEETSPASTRTTPLSQAQNRRVEISVQ